MPEIGIKINGIAWAHAMFIAAEQHDKVPAQHMKKLRTQVRVRPCVSDKGEELSQIRMKLSLAGSGIELGEDVRRASRRGRGRKLLVRLFACERDQMAALFVAEEVVQSDVECAGDAKEGGNRRDQFTVFNLGQERGRQ